MSLINGYNYANCNSVVNGIHEPEVIDLEDDNDAAMVNDNNNDDVAEEIELDDDDAANMVNDNNDNDDVVEEIELDDDSDHANAVDEDNEEILFIPIAQAQGKSKFSLSNLTGSVFRWRIPKYYNS